MIFLIYLYSKPTSKIKNKEKKAKKAKEKNTANTTRKKKGKRRGCFIIF